MRPADRAPQPKKKVVGARATFCLNQIFCLEDQLAARMLTSPPASEVSFWSVAF